MMNPFFFFCLKPLRIIRKNSNIFRKQYLNNYINHSIRKILDLYYFLSIKLELNIIYTINNYF